MKYTILLIMSLSLMNFIPNNLNISKSKANFKEKIFRQITVTEQFYNRLAIGQRIVSTTNRFVDKKKLERPGIPAEVWQNVKDGISYASFKNDAISILNNNLTTAKMQQLISEYEGKTYIPLTNLKIKKELLDVGNNFRDGVNLQIKNILSNNGY